MLGWGGLERDQEQASASSTCTSLLWSGGGTRKHSQIPLKNKNPQRWMVLDFLYAMLRLEGAEPFVTFLTFPEEREGGSGAHRKPNTFFLFATLQCGLTSLLDRFFADCHLSNNTDAHSPYET